MNESKLAGRLALQGTEFFWNTFFPFAAQQGKGVISKNSAPCQCSVLRTLRSIRSDLLDTCRH